MYSDMIAGAKRLGLVDASGKIDASAIKAIPQYRATRGTLEVGYKEAHRRFKNKRRKMGYGKGLVM